MLLVLKAVEPLGPERSIPPGKPFTMGRGPDNDWVIADPDREVSKVHCRIESDGHGFMLVDLSINGVVIDGETGPMGPGRRHRLAAGHVFSIGQFRFEVIGTGTEDEADARSGATGNVLAILDGFGDGTEARASGAVSGDAARWLSDIPKGSAEAGMREPQGWAEPPGSDRPILPPDLDGPASEFANRSEHLPATQTVLHLPQTGQVLPPNWLADDDLDPPPRAAPAASRPILAFDEPRSESRVDDEDARSAFLAGARLDPAALAETPVDELFRRGGEAFRALLDGLDTIEAAQAVAERDCGLGALSETSGPADFFAESRDPATAILTARHGEPAQSLVRRFEELADRQRALGRAVAEAASRFDAELAPDRLGHEGGRLRVGPFAKAAAWTRFTERFAAIARNGDNMPSFLALLRKCRVSVTTQQP